MRDTEITASPKSLERRLEKENSTGLFDILTSVDNILLLDFSGSMNVKFEDIPLFRHLINAVEQYDGEYDMVAFRSYARKIEDLYSEKPFGSTNLVAAMEIAVQDNARNYVIISDGIPNEPAQAIDFAKRHKMKCSTLFIGDHPNGREFMKHLSEETGGKSGDIKLLKGFAGLLEQKIKGLLT